MLKYIPIAALALLLVQLDDVSADRKSRHHGLGSSHRKGDTHTRQQRHHSRSEEEHNSDLNGKHINGKHHVKHRENRKAGSFAQQTSLLSTVEMPAGNLAPQQVHIPPQTAAPEANANLKDAPLTESTPNSTVASPTTKQESVSLPSADVAAPTQNTGNAINDHEEGKNNNKESDINPVPDIVCKYLWFFFKRCNTADKVASNDQNTADNKAEVEGNEEAITPVVSTSCNIYGTAVLSLNDFKETEEGAWILVNEFNSPRITHNKQVNADKPAHIELKNVICNAATYEATIKLGVDSSGGFTIRGSEQNLIVFEMNTLSKTATLKSINGPYQDIISDVQCDLINSQFVQKVQIKDTGYKGQIEVQIDGKKVISVSNLPFRSSGLFGLYITQGNASFGDISVLPLKDLMLLR